MMIRNRGCFERHDDECDSNEFASPPCYMHEVDPSYFGLPRSARPMPDRKPDCPKVILNARPKAHVPREAIVAWPELRSFTTALSRSIGRHVATLIERVEARRQVQAVARLHSRNGLAR